jgi:hypothetical protein
VGGFNVEFLCECEVTGTLTELSPTKSNLVWHAKMCKNMRKCFAQSSCKPLSHYTSHLEASEAEGGDFAASQ